jgi:DNA-binding winged helix-turn-helix (wHTH) protein
MASVIFRFGDYEVDTGVFEIRRAGTLVPVEPQVFDVLVYLIAHRDRVVPKEEILDQVWGDRFVSESALTSRLKSARRALGDDGKAQRVIRTFHGRGYRFVAVMADDAVQEAGVVTPISPVAVAAGSTAVLDQPVLVRRTAPPTAPASSVRPPDPDGRASRPAGWPLLGRSDELAALAAWFDDPDSGGVLLTGEAGMGKSRLAEECVRLAEAAGVPVARAVGHPEGRGLPLAALTHILPVDVAQAGPDGELDLAAVFHRARSALRRPTGGERLLLAVDDVDQLDDISVAVLASLVMAREVFAVLTMRTPAELPGALRTLTKDGHLHRLDLPPLTPIILETLLHRVLGAAVEADTTATLVDTAMGNAGVLRQLVDSSLEAAVLVLRGEQWTLDGPLVTTSGLEQLVEDRLSGLGGEGRQALELLAVTGRLGLDLLSARVGIEAIEDLDDRGLLEVHTSRRRTEVAVAHPLFGEVLRRQLPALRGRRIRRTAADAVEGVGARRREDRVRITAWRLEAGGAVDVEALADATRLALADGDYGTSDRLLERLRLDGDPVLVTQLRAEWHYRRSESDRVEELLAPLVLDDIPPDVRTQIVRRRASNRFYGMGDFEGAVALLEAALEPMAGPPREALEASRATLLALGGEVERAVRASEGLIPGASGVIRFELLRARSLALAACGRGDAAVALVHEGQQLRTRLGSDLYLPGQSMLWFAGIVALTELGRFEDAARTVLDVRARGSELGWATFGAARLALAIGDTGSVRRLLDRHIVRSRGWGHGATERWLLALVAHARLLEGDVERATEDLARVAELEDGPRALFHNEIDRAHAWLAAERDGTGAAVARLLVSAEDAKRLGKLAFEATLLHDVVRLGHASQVVERLAALAEQVEGPLMGCRVLHARGRVADDPSMLESAAVGFEGLGSPLLAAEGWADASASWLRAGRREVADGAAAKGEELRRSFGVRLVTPALARSDRS